MSQWFDVTRMILMLCHIRRVRVIAWSITINTFVEHYKKLKKHTMEHLKGIVQK